MEVFGHRAAEVALRRTVRRAVVVREGEVSDAEVERSVQDRALGFKRLVVADVVPETQGDRREVQAACPARGFHLGKDSGPQATGPRGPLSVLASAVVMSSRSRSSRVSCAAGSQP